LNTDKTRRGSFTLWEATIDIERKKIDCLRFVMCSLLAPPNPKGFLLRPFRVLMRQTRQAVHAIKQSISLDVYGRSVAKITETVPILTLAPWPTEWRPKSWGKSLLPHSQCNGASNVWVCWICKFAKSIGATL